MFSDIQRMSDKKSYHRPAALILTINNQNWCTKTVWVCDHKRFKSLLIQKNGCIHPWRSWNPSLASKVF